MTAFDEIAKALAVVLGTDQVTAGFVMGVIVIFVGLIAMSLAFGGGSRGSSHLLFAGSAGMIFVILAGWWPLWTMLVLVLVVVFLIMGPFRSGDLGD